MPDETSTLNSRDGTALHMAAWRVRQPNGTVIISHGLGEHLGRYEDVARAIATNPDGFDVVAFDYRGHGKSPGARGSVRRFDALFEDQQAVIDHVEQNERRPMFLLGHSLGGLFALRATLQEKERFAGLVLSSPALELSMPVSRWKRAAGNVLHALAPSLAIAGPVPPHYLATRPGYAEEHKADTLRHSKICAHIYFGMQDLGRRLLEDAPRQGVPLLVLTGAHDRVTSPQAAQRLVETWGGPDAVMRLFINSAHEPLNDLERDDVIKEIRRWLVNHVQKQNAPQWPLALTPRSS